MKKTSALLFLLFLLSGMIITASAWANDDIRLTQSLKGSEEIRKDSSIVVEDNKFFDAGYNAKLVKPYPVQNRVTFKINEQSTTYLSSSFSETVHLRIYSTRADLSIDSVDKAFTINYNGDSIYNSQASFVFSGAYSVQVLVLDTASTVNWNVWD